jgi:hypothetical protein
MSNPQRMRGTMPLQTTLKRFARAADWAVFNLDPGDPPEGGTSLWVGGR